jgi:two-component system heavy metal sensor histidine kinase CusS
MTSIRGRVLAGAMATAGVVLAGSGAAVYLLLRASLLDEFDAGLQLQARSLAAMVDAHVEGGRVRYHPEIPEDWRSMAYVLRGEGGAIIVRSAPAAAAGLVPGAAAGVVGALRLPDGAPGRSGTWTFTAGEEAEDVAPGAPAPTIEVTTARSAAGVEQALRRLAWVLASVTAAACAVAGVVMGWILTRALAPLDQLATRIAGLDDRSLGTPLPLPEQRELAPVVARLNALLAGLDQAFAKEKSFNAAIAHELRTPLAGLLTTIEVCRSRERAPEEYREALAACQAMAGELRAMIERLLLLAKLDAGLVAITPRAVALPELLADCWAPQAAVAAARGLAVEWSHGHAGPLVTDRECLRMVVANLLDNAVSHAAAPGAVRIATSDEAGALVLAVRNPAAALPPAALGRIFDRFWRGDAARAATGRHCGLGLSLCHDLVAALGGTIAATSAEGSFLVTVRLPVAGAVA